MKEWSDFFVATAGSAAALTGLIFVGVSISLNKILSLPTLPERAIIALILLVNILLMSIFSLIPAQSMHAFGAEIAMSGLVIWMIITRIDSNIHRRKEKQYRRKRIFNINFDQTYLNIILDQLAILPFILGGIYVFFAGEQGIYWIVPGIMFSFIKSVLDAWVFLIEIHR
jgi:hypothetical protein